MLAVSATLLLTMHLGWKMMKMGHEGAPGFIGPTPKIVGAEWVE